MDNKTKDYLTRLIAGVREQAEKECEWFANEPVTPPRWLDAVLLCDVVEKELIEGEL